MRAIMPDDDYGPLPDDCLESDPDHPSGSSVRLAVTGRLVVIETWGADGMSRFKLEADDLAEWLAERMLA